MSQNRSRSTQGHNLKIKSKKKNMMEPESPMLHTKFRGNRFTDSGEEFLKGFNHDGRGGHLGHVTKMLLPLPMQTPHKIWL